MKHTNKFFAIFTAVVMTVTSFAMLSTSAADTSGAVVSELGNTAAISGLEYSTVDAHSGSRSIHISNVTANETNIAKAASLGMEAGKSYNFSFYIKGTLTSSNGMYIRTGWNWDVNQAKIKSDANGVFRVEAGTNWTVTADTDGWYKVESKTPWSYNSPIDFFKVMKGGTVDFYIDDLSITESVSGAELISNGGFEEITQPEATPEPTPEPTPTPTPEPSGSDTSGAVITEFGNTEAIAGLEYSTIDAYEGTRAIHITKNGEMTTPTKLGLTSGATYNISFMIKGICNTSNGMYMRMGWSYASNAAKIKSDSSGVFTVPESTGEGILKVTSAEDGWYKVESIIPWTCSEMNIGFFNVTSGGGTLNFYIDKLSIVDAETGTEMMTNGGFEPPAVEVGEFETSTTPEGKQKVSVSVKNNSAGGDISAILVLATVKDKVMQAKETDLPENNTISEGNGETLEAEITVNEGETLTAYLWDSLGGKTPLRDAEVLE